MQVIKEGAVYKLAFSSNKPEAERFTNWIAGEVIPQIRKTGTAMPVKMRPRTQKRPTKRFEEVAGRSFLLLTLWGRFGFESHCLHHLVVDPF